MTSILIVGYGNPLRSDDGLGCLVAEQLRNLPHAQVLACHQLTSDLAELLSKVEMVVFIDAATGGEHGGLRCEQVFPETSALRFSHVLSPAAVLGVAQQLYGAAPRAFVVSLCGECFELGEGLSPKIAAKLPEVVGLVSDLVRIESEKYATCCPQAK